MKIEVTLPDELFDMIREIVKEEVALLKPDSSLVFRTRDEATKILKISMPTLDRYIQLGIINGFKVGNRILFTEESLQKALVKFEKRKYKRA